MRFMEKWWGSPLIGISVAGALILLTDKNPNGRGGNLTPLASFILLGAALIIVIYLLSRFICNKKNRRKK